ncbi:ADP-ribose diphosphatase [Vibrio sp.]|nr:ADP-ribose diphosphatase [Vibrio sp.]
MSINSQFNKKDIDILKEETVFKGFFKMIKYTFKHRCFGGEWSRPVEREMFERGPAAAMLPYDPINDSVVLVEQIRVGALYHEQPWQFEIVAGMTDDGETSEDVIRRESVEEAGLEVGRLESILSYYPSSGGCSEKIDIFVGEVDATQAQGVYGLDYEDEDIQVHRVTRQEALDMVTDGRIENASTIIALQWLALHADALKERWAPSNE